MCHFLSAIYVRRSEGVYDILTAPHKTDSHTDLEKIFGLNDARDDPTYVKVEFVPPQDTTLITNVDKWQFKLDARRGATWFDDDRRDDCIARLNALVSAHIITERHCEIRDDWIIACGSSTVTAWDSSKVTAFHSSTVTARDSSKVTARDSSSVTAYGSSTVIAYDSSTVTAWDSSTVESWKSSTVTAGHTSTVAAFHSSTVTAFHSSTVTAYGSSTVTAYGSSTVIARDSSKVSTRDLAYCVDRRASGAVSGFGAGGK